MTAMAPGTIVHARELETLIYDSNSRDLNVHEMKVCSADVISIYVASSHRRVRVER